MIACLFIIQEICVFIVIPQVQSGLWQEQGRGTGDIMKCFVNLGFGLTMLAILTVNPSLSLIISALYSPLCIVTPTKRETSTMLSYLLDVVLVGLSPPAIFFWMTLLGNNCIMYVETAISHWNLYGAIILPVAIGIYWPLNMMLRVLKRMP